MKISGLYVVTDTGVAKGKSHIQIAREAVAGGAAVIQLRDKTASSAEMYAQACEISGICRNHALFVVNDRIDIALASGADGVHLGQHDIPLDAARKICGPDFIIGISVGSVEEADRAVAGGASYLAVSPVFTTTTKPDAGPGHGISLIREIRRKYPSVSLVGIGGFTLQNVSDAVVAGLDSVAVVSAVVGSSDISSAAREFVRVLNRSGV